MSLVPENSLIHRLHDQERRQVDNLVVKYNSGKLQPLDAMIEIGVLAGMRKFRHALEQSFISQTTKETGNDNE